MKPRSRRWSVLVFVVLLLAACKDKHDPLKPTLARAATLAAASAT